ncbi:MAG: DUF2442 domain-containing protein [Planctomycetes bacterium]|nr:DUF2442 domain-containing protein [Planctomycetota bacterium]
MRSGRRLRDVKRIVAATPLRGLRLRLTLTDGSIIERDVSSLMVGPIFASLRGDPARFAEVRIEGGSVVWPNGADLCPDVLIQGHPGRRDSASRRRSTGRGGVDGRT